MFCNTFPFGFERPTVLSIKQFFSVTHDDLHCLIYLQLWVSFGLTGFYEFLQYIQDLFRWWCWHTCADVWNVSPGFLSHLDTTNICSTSTLLSSNKLAVEHLIHFASWKSRFHCFCAHCRVHSHRRRSVSAASQLKGSQNKMKAIKSNSLLFLNRKILYCKS